MNQEKRTENADFKEVSTTFFGQELSCEIQEACKYLFITRYGKEMSISSDDSGLNHTVVIPHYDKHQKHPYVFNVKTKEKPDNYGKLSRLIEAHLKKEGYAEIGSLEIYSEHQ